MAREMVVKTEGLTKEYRSLLGRRRVLALDDLNLEVFRGEIVGLLGPNGSGKTTALKLLMGFLHPSRGSVRVLDREATDVPTKARIGFLPEDSYFHPFLDAEETLDFYARLFGMPRAVRKREIGRLLLLVGLDAVRRRPLREYSKGMCRRIGIAQALINDPELLFLDEPTTGLDPIGAGEMKKLLVELKSRGKTVVLCSHLLADIEQVCDRIAILSGGKLITMGRTADLLTLKESLQIRTGHVEEPVKEEIRAFLASKGVQVESMECPSETLEGLFLKVVKGR